MRPPRARRLPLWLIAAGFAVGAAWIGWLSSQHLAGTGMLLDRAETPFGDLRLQFAGPRKPAQQVAIVAIDDATVQRAGGFPLERAILADLVSAIADRGAAALAVDLLLVDAGNPDGDRALALALGRIPTVIAAAGVFSATATYTVPRPIRIVSPRAEFAVNARVGLVNVSTDAGGTPRHLPLVFLAPSGPAPSLVVQALGAYLGSSPAIGRDAVTVDGEPRRLDLGFHLPLRYLGAAGAIPTLSAIDVLDGNGPADALRGRLVFLGATATGIGDRFSTPFDPILPGVEVLATGASNLLDGAALVRDARIRRLDVTASASLAAAGGLLVIALPLVPGIATFAALLLAWLAATALLFVQGTWFSAALPLAAAVPPVALLATLRELLDRRQAKRTAMSEQQLGRLQAPALARRLAVDPGFLLEPQERSLPVLFVDLAGFTGLSESLGHVETRRVLKGFHTLVVEAADAHDAVVMSFMGDGAMIVHGVPDEGDQDAGKALRLAFALVDATHRWIDGNGLAKRIAGLRVGLHFGPVVLSRLGHDAQQHITVTGDSVNVASRLMEVAKTHRATLAVSTTALDRAAACGTDIPAPDMTLSVKIRGRREPLRVALWQTVARRS
jgi:adenylate cyclase